MWAIRNQGTVYLSLPPPSLSLSPDFTLPPWCDPDSGTTWPCSLISVFSSGAVLYFKVDQLVKGEAGRSQFEVYCAFKTSKKYITRRSSTLHKGRLDLWSRFPLNESRFTLSKQTARSNRIKQQKIFKISSATKRSSKNRVSIVWIWIFIFFVNFFWISFQLKAIRRALRKAFAI